jgi:apolipoprotein N-acyltransferase
VPVDRPADSKVHGGLHFIVGAIGLSFLAIAGFHLAYSFPSLAWLTVLLPISLIGFALHPNRRVAFYLPLLTGLGCYAPKLAFFWTIFGPAAIPLWLVLSFWLGIFGLLVWFLNSHLGTAFALLAAPVVWTAVEFFRSELYFLRFAWLTPGMAFDQWPQVVGTLGIYGTGFVLSAVAALVWKLVSTFSVGRWALNVSEGRTPNIQRPTPNAQGLAIAAFLLVAAHSAPAKPLHLAGVQLEFPTHDQVLAALDRAIAERPETDLIVFSEYTFDSPPPKSVRDWCRVNRRHLIAGGKDPTPDGDFYNTAFVVGPDGEIVFRQAKSQPIQFFKDGKPAPSQQLWDSPWGRIGLAVCCDDGYTHIMDELVRQGAQLLIIPTMDVVEWGRAQHELHARLGPIRAAEYRILVVRVCSSGVSQVIGANGVVLSSLPFTPVDESDSKPGNGIGRSASPNEESAPHPADPPDRKSTRQFSLSFRSADARALAPLNDGILFASLDLSGSGHLPPDRWLVRGCVAVTPLLLIGCFIRRLRPKADGVAASPPPSSKP